MSELRLRVPAEAGYVVVVRELLRGIDRFLSTRPGLSEAVQTAVSEAANNVVMHAYDGAAGPVGPLEVDVSLGGPLEIWVRDRGVGFDPSAEPEASEESGFGRAVIDAFADDVQIRSQQGEGSELRLRWAVPALFAGPAGGGEPLTGETVLSVRADPVFADPVARVMTALGARIGLTVDRLGDLQLIADALITNAAGVVLDGDLSLAFLRRGGRLQISAGPFAPGGADAVRAARTVAGTPLLDRLADELEVLRDPGTDQEVLILSVGEA